MSIDSRLDAVVRRSQALAQMQHRIALAREKRIHADARRRRHLLETAPVQFVRDEHLALIRGQFFERGAQRVEQRGAGVSRLGSRIGRRERQIEAVFAIGCVGIRVDAIGQRRFLLLAEAVDDPVSRDAIQPRTDLLDRLGQSPGFDEFFENVLKDVVGFVLIDHAAADEIAQPRPLAGDGSSNFAVLHAQRARGVGRFHTRVDDPERKILWRAWPQREKKRRALQRLRRSAAARPLRYATSRPNGRTQNVYFATISQRGRALFIDSIWWTVIMLFVPVGSTNDLLLTDPSNAAALLALWFFAGQCVPIVITGLMWAAWGTTPGKRACHLRIVDAQSGERMSVTQSMLRTFGYLLTFATLGAGFLWVFFNPKKQALHDRIANTVVIDEALTAANSANAMNVSRK